jgi:cold shock CspA family protein/ribosome-associated translation inhibitor RaiA
MQGPIELSFKGIQKTKDVEDLIYEKVAKLEQICDHMISCRITVEKPQRYQRTGSPFRVCIDMTITPGHELVVKHKSTEGNLHDPLPSVLREAFNAALRQLKELVQRQQGEVKTHFEQQPAAFVAKIFPEEKYGFLKTVNGREIYFHKNSVLHNDFDHLEVGMGVRFVAELGEKGPQASTVEIVDKQGAP